MALQMWHTPPFPSLSAQAWRPSRTVAWLLVALVVLLCATFSDTTSTPTPTSTPSPTGTTTSTPSSRTPAISASASGTCALFQDGGIVCWGYGWTSTLVTFTKTSLPDFTSLWGGEPFVDLCASDSAGKAVCCGNNAFGQLGQGDTTSRSCFGSTTAAIPVIDFGTNVDVVSMDANGGVTCAISSSGGLKCVGSNDGGGLGQGDTVNRGGLNGLMGDLLPYVDLGTGKKAAQVTVADGSTCVLLTDKTVKCFGWSVSANGFTDTLVGDQPNEMGDNLPTVPFPGGLGALDVSSSYRWACAVLTDQSVTCWGDNSSFGRLGIGSTAGVYGSNSSPLSTVNLGGSGSLKATAVRTGADHACVLFTTGQVKCWGGNSYGQLGAGDLHNRGTSAGDMGDNLPFLSLGTGRKVQSIALGDNHTCVLFTDYNMACFGRNDQKQLGYGDTLGRGYLATQMGDNLALLPLNLLQSSTPPPPPPPPPPPSPPPSPPPPPLPLSVHPHLSAPPRHPHRPPPTRSPVPTFRRPCAGPDVADGGVVCCV